MGILVSGGLPEPCCPNCRTDNWGWSGGSDNEPIIVTCRTCGRHYVTMDAAERYSYYAARAGSAFRRSDLVLTRQYQVLMSSIFDRYQDIKDSPPILICVGEGSSEWMSDDATPF